MEGSDALLAPESPPHATLASPIPDNLRESLQRALMLGAQIEQTLHQRRPNGEDVSIRKVARRLQPSVGSSTAWRAHAIHQLCCDHPEVANCTHLGVAHLGVLLGAPKRHRLELLRRAEAERWSRTRLSRVVERLRSAETSGGRRRPLENGAEPGPPGVGSLAGV